MFNAVNQTDTGTPRRLPALSLVHDLIALMVLAAAAVIALGSGIDARMFVNGDTLYPVQVLHFGWLEYRPPPSNSLFPDVLVHWLLQFVLPEPLQQKLAAGAILFLVSAVVIGATRGYFCAVLFVAIYSITGFYFFDSTAHFSLPLCLALVLWARSPVLRLVLIIVGVFSDLMLLLPLTVVLLAPAVAPGCERSTHNNKMATCLVIGLAVALNLIYSELNEAAVKLLPMLLAFAATVSLARRMGLRNLMLWVLVVALPVLALAGLVAERYAAPIAACMLLLLVPQVPAQWPGWRTVALPLAYTGLLMIGLNTSGYERLSAQYSCLVKALRSQQIDNVAVDHWTAKQLYFAALDQTDSLVATPQALTITQLDFAEGDSHLWMAPHAFYGRPTQWAVHNRYACRTFTSEAKYCGQQQTAPVLSTQAVCGVFDLIRYEHAIPVASAVAPATKGDWINLHGRNYLGKLASLLQHGL